MKTLQQRIIAFTELGCFLSQFTSSEPVKNNTVSANAIFYDAFQEQITFAQQKNGWFTKENLAHCFSNWAALLTQEKLEKWLEPYTIAPTCDKTIAIIMAGNIPLVGFHDFLSVLITGHKTVIKLSSNDSVLLPVLAAYLQEVEPYFKDRIVFCKEQLPDFDGVIATGSNNTARYFEHYFSKKPHIIRKNRNSVAVLTGEETTEQLTNLGKDIFNYYGLGCRSVSKLFVPKGYDFDAFFKAIYDFHPIIDSAKYANNYDYNKAVYLMSLFDLLDNGFLLLKEDENYASPIATLFYSNYDTLEQLEQELLVNQDKIQCIVSSGGIQNSIYFGQSQAPALEQYADNVDTIAFLTQI